MSNAWMRGVLAVLFWLGVWQAASLVIDQSLLLASPTEVIARLGLLVQTGDFWASVGTSLANIATGFVLAFLAGTLAAVLASKLAWFRALLSPLMSAIKAVPVASFVILVLIWVSSKHLSVVISFLMVLPIVYTNMLEGINETDRELLEMADVFGMHRTAKLKYVYGLSVLPYFETACSLALGMSWKAGIAAEVIGIPAPSIGEHLYEAKVYLDTPDLFAWTLVVVLISALIEQAFRKGVSWLVRRWERSI